MALVCVQAYRSAVGFELIVLATAFVCFRHDRTQLRLSASLALAGALQAWLAENLAHSLLSDAVVDLLVLAVLALAWCIASRPAASATTALRSAVASR